MRYFSPEQIMIEIIKNVTELTFCYQKGTNKLKEVGYSTFFNVGRLADPLISLTVSYNEIDYENEKVIPIQIRIFNSEVGETGENIYFDLDEFEKIKGQNKYQRFFQSCSEVLNDFYNVQENDSVSFNNDNSLYDFFAELA